MLSLSRPAVDIHNNSLDYAYTSVQVDKALKAASQRMYFRYALLDSSNNLKQLLDTVESGSIAYDTVQQIKRTAKFTMQDDGSINFISDRIQPFALLQMTDGAFAQFPLGVFLLSTPPRQTDPSLVVTRSVDAYDLLQILVDDKVADRYTVTAGTRYTDAITTLLQSAGFTQMNITSDPRTLPTTLDWKIGTAKLTIIDALTTPINYRQLWVDENGIPIGQPYLVPDQRAPEYTYQDDANSVTFPQVNQALDLFSVPNKWVCVVTETDRAVITSQYTNSNPDSPTSTVNRGRTIVKYVTASNAPDQASNDTYAQQMAYKDSQVYETVNFSTAIMPFHADLDVFTFIFSKLGLSAKFEEVAWSFPLQAGGQMKHAIRKTVSI